MTIPATPEPESTALPLLAAVLGAPPARVTAALTLCRPEDVALIDPPTAVALGVALDLAAEGTPPSLPTLDAELLRTGRYRSHTGHLVRTRVLDAGTFTPIYPELLDTYAAAALAQVLRAQYAATGQALADEAADAPEADLWMLLKRDGVRLRHLAERLGKLRDGNEAAA